MSAERADDFNHHTHRVALVGSTVPVDQFAHEAPGFMRHPLQRCSSNRTPTTRRQMACLLDQEAQRKIRETCCQIHHPSRFPISDKMGRTYCVAWFGMGTPTRRIRQDGQSTVVFPFILFSRLLLDKADSFTNCCSHSPYALVPALERSVGLFIDITHVECNPGGDAELDCSCPV